MSFDISTHPSLWSRIYFTSAGPYARAFSHLRLMAKIYYSFFTHGPVEWDARAASHHWTYLYGQNHFACSIRKSKNIIIAISSSQKEYHISWIVRRNYLLTSSLRHIVAVVRICSVIEILTGKYSKKIPRCDVPSKQSFINNHLQKLQMYVLMMKNIQNSSIWPILWNLRRQETPRDE